MASLPVLNLSLFAANPTAFARQLRQACHTVGFFLLRHDIPPHICKNAFNETRQFFQRPLAEKMTITYENEPSFRGYMPLGVENTEGRVDGREQVEYAAEFFRRDSRVNEKEERHYHRLRTSNPWPDHFQPNLRPAVMEFVDGVLDVADQLRDAMCLALNVDPHEVASLFGVRNKKPIECEKVVRAEKSDGEEPFWSMKLISYPTVASLSENSKEDGFNSQMSASSQGVGAHTDTNFLTLILQDPHHAGLQVQSMQDGSWINVPPTKETILVCNLGELAEIWTGGYFLATPHRVTRDSSDNNGGRHSESNKNSTLVSRTSIPIFYNPTMDTVMKPMVDLDNLPWERTQRNQWRREQNTMFSSVGENSFKSLARSHPAVFERHHSDLKISGDGKITKQ